MRTSPREINPENSVVKAMDEALKENPPIIHWRKNNHGVFVAHLIDDPHADIGHKAPGSKVARSRSFADKLVAEFPIACERETPLLSAARKDV